MRKIMTREEIERKDKRRGRIIGIILGIIMLFSTAGYMVIDFLGNKPITLDYNGVSFEQVNGLWQFKYQNYNFQTRYNPLDSENISIDLTKNIGDYISSSLYYAVDDEFNTQNEALSEILINLNQFQTRVNPACLNASCSNANAPTKTCDSNVLIFKQSDTNSSSIKQEKNCIYFYYAPGDSIVEADAFLFRILGIN